MTIKYYSKLFVRLLLFLSAVDTINGFFLNKGIESPIGILFKAFIMLVAIRILIVNSKFKGLIFFTITYISVFLMFIILNTDSQLTPTLTHLFKFVNIVFVYYAAVVVLKLGFIQKKELQTIFYVNSVVLLLNVYSGLLGIGYYAYGENLGCKGFIYAHNEMSGMMAVLFGVSYFFLYAVQNSNRITVYLSNLIFLVAALLVSTKAGILLVSISLILVPFVNMKYGMFRAFLRTSKLRIMIFLIVLCLVIYYSYLLLDYSGAIERWIYFFEKSGINAIYSSRDSYWAEEKLEWEEGNIGVKLFGMGGDRTVEMDQADTLLNYGIFGVIIVYSFYLSLVIKAFRRRRESKYAKFVFGMNLFILAASCFAGHLLFSGLMGIPFALMNVMIFYSKMKNEQLNIA